MTTQKVTAAACICVIAMPCPAMLWFALLCFMMLCHAVLCCAMLCHAKSCCAMLWFALLCSNAQHRMSHDIKLSQYKDGSLSLWSKNRDRYQATELDIINAADSACMSFWPLCFVQIAAETSSHVSCYMVPPYYKTSSRVPSQVLFGNWCTAH